MIDKKKTNQKGYTNKNNNKDDMVDKKKKLQEAFVKNTIKTSSDPVEVAITENIKDDDKTQELESKLSKLTKENKSKDLKINELKDEIKKMKNGSDKLKQKYDKVYFSVEELKSQLQDKDSIIQKKDLEIVSLKQQISVNADRLQELENLVGVGYVHELELQNQKLQEDHKKIMQRIKSLQDTYKNQYSVIYDKEEIFNSKFKEIVANSRRHITSYREENSKLINTISELNKKIENLTEKNKNMKPIESKAIKPKMTKDKIKKKIKWYLNNLYMTLTRKKYIKTDTLRGFLILDELTKKLTFKDTLGNVYKIRYYKKKWMKTEIGAYAVTHLDEHGEVIVVYVGNNKEYEEYIKTTEIRKIRKNKKALESQVSEKEKTSKCFYDYKYKVLVITSMAQIKYINYLTSLGLEVDAFDSYKESAKRLESILSKYDVVLYCVRHSKHYVGDVLKNQSDYKEKSWKYNLVSNDSLQGLDNIISEKIQIIEGNKE